MPDPTGRTGNKGAASVDLQIHVCNPQVTEICCAKTYRTITQTPDGSVP
jgi:hypothetical protein